MSATLELARALIERVSLTPEDAGCQQLVAERLQSSGFTVEWFPFGDVTNVLITHGRSHHQHEPSLWFLGHTDVVPAGPLEDWASAPFTAEVRDNMLYGRGAADMKGAVAAMVVALESAVLENPGHAGQIGLLLTSDEEGIAENGIKQVAKLLQSKSMAPQFCLVGEPSSRQRLGDTVRIGRRGSIHAHLTVHGVQGHSAFPESIDNPIHRLAAFMQLLTETQWDAGDENFPPSHCQLTNIQAGTGAENVTPGHAEAWFNFRNSPASSAADLKTKVEVLLQQKDIRHFDLDWRVSGEPFRSEAGALRAAVIDAIEQEMGIQPELNTGGGTSDGRFIAPLGTEVVELGLLNRSIHQIDEHVPVDDLDSLARVYGQTIKELWGIYRSEPKE